jgi:hypothetical protein
MDWFGKQAKAGIAVHVKIRTNTSMGRHFAIDGCYLSNHLLCKHGDFSLVLAQA